MRAGRQHLDLDVLGQVLGNVASMLLGAAVDVGAVPLNDDRDLHCRSSSRCLGSLRCLGCLGCLGCLEVLRVPQVLRSVPA